MYLNPRVAFKLYHYSFIFQPGTLLCSCFEYILAWNTNVQLYTNIFQPGTLLCSCFEYILAWNTTVQFYTNIFQPGTLLCSFIRIYSSLEHYCIVVYEYILAWNTTVQLFQIYSSLEHYSVVLYEYILAWNTTVQLYTNIFQPGTLLYCENQKWTICCSHDYKCVKDWLSISDNFSTTAATFLKNKVPNSLMGLKA